jgi:phage terminase large subunit GpA-like protein
LTAEKQVTRYHKGFARREFVKVRPRNEALDVRVYAMAAFGLLNVNLKSLEKRLFTQHENPPEPETIEPLVPRRVQRPQKSGGFVNGWR